MKKRRTGKRLDQMHYTKKHQAHPNAGASFHPRSLFRGLTVPYSDSPGQKHLYPLSRFRFARNRPVPLEAEAK